MRYIIFQLLAVLLPCLSCLAEADTRPNMVAERLSTAPMIDGNVLGDDAWQGLTAASAFTQVRPFEGKPSSQATEVRIGFDDEALYIGVVCHDDEPGAIVVGDARRDSLLDDVDSFQVLIDTFNDGQNGFIFGTTPSSVEYDAQVIKEGNQPLGTAGSGFNLEWNTSWTVRSAIGDHGWSAELRIPFRSLRYRGSDSPVWGLNC